MTTAIRDLFDELPMVLSERSRILNDAALPCLGDFVLYWMRHAMRVDENPALDLAILIANRLEVPLIIFQEFSGAAPYASDRHWTFQFEAASELAEECRERNWNYFVHVERPQQPGTHLQTLCDRAVVCIAEEMPVPAHQDHLNQLAESSRTPVVSVDTACIVPMLRVGRAYTRAFEYRNATHKLYDERIDVEWPIVDNVKTHSDLELPFEPVDFTHLAISDLVSQCEIDHSIGPVPHTKGGSSAGYARWEAFKDHGLAKYDKRRNNPLLDGTSRLSPYLHYGMVSPFRIAREAAATKLPGADKFLDELLIWRELAYSFCFYQSDLETLNAIPAWARETFNQHASDPRPAELSWETLSRGKTGDKLWDAAQRSLLMQGELHNNVRMTWGKALLQWTKSPTTALEMLVDLNHRYALDGQDPASYGGILWCLGQFDRPFSPEKPILGKVRGRATSEHAQRLDTDRYFQKLTSPPSGRTSKIAIVGAGLSGLICGRLLNDHGFDVTVFEKSRGSGGRMATRRTGAGFQFDHGAQYFTVKDERFQRYVASWLQAGLIAEWKGRIGTLTDGQCEQKENQKVRYVGIPGMSALGSHLARDLSVNFGQRVLPPEKQNGSWVLKNEIHQDLGQFDWIVISTPAPQAAELLRGSCSLDRVAKQVSMEGCWAAALIFEEPLNLPLDGAFVHNSPLSWIARDNSKPGRDNTHDVWVLHASADWSRPRLDHASESLLPELEQAFWEATAIAPQPAIETAIHRWRYAIPPNPLASRCLFDPQEKIGACGDWCSGPRVEGAFLSGMAMAGRILGNVEFNVPT